MAERRRLQDVAGELIDLVLPTAGGAVESIAGFTGLYYSIPKTYGPLAFVLEGAAAMFFGFTTREAILNLVTKNPQHPRYMQQMSALLRGAISAEAAAVFATGSTLLMNLAMQTTHAPGWLTIGADVTTAAVNVVGWMKPVFSRRNPPVRQ